MSNSTNICLPCGMCCDGTLIGFVEVNKEEIPRLNDLLDIEDGGDSKGIFLQPCKKFCEVCTIYAERPKHCGLFKCGLLNAVNKKETSFNDALETINKVKNHKASIENQLKKNIVDLKSKSFYFKMVELKRLSKSKPSYFSNTDTNLALINELTILDDLLMANFGICF